MHLEKIEGKDIYINTNRVIHGKDISMTRLFKMTAMALSLGAKSVREVDDLTEEEMKDKIVIQFLNDTTGDKVGLYNTVNKNAKLVFDVFWCDLAMALTLEEIWSNGKMVGWHEYEKNSAIIMGDINESEFLFFDTKFENYDYIMNGVNK